MLCCAAVVDWHRGRCHHVEYDHADGTGVSVGRQCKLLTVSSVTATVWFVSYLVGVEVAALVCWQWMNEWLMPGSVCSAGLVMQLCAMLYLLAFKMPEQMLAVVSTMVSTMWVAVGTLLVVQWKPVSVTGVDVVLCKAGSTGDK